MPVRTSTHEIAALSAQIERRRTHRGPFEPWDPDPEVLAGLVAAVEAEGGALVLVDGESRGALAELVAEGDRVQFADPRWRRELAAWMHSPRDHDGLPIPALKLPMTRMVVSAVDLGASTGRSDRSLALDAPVVAVLTTLYDDAASWLAAGQALQRLLLVASAAGLHVGYLNQPCQVADLRPRLAELIGTDHYPQVVLRIGRASAPDGVQRRRPTEEVLTDVAPTPFPDASEGEPVSRRGFLRRAGIGAATAFVVADGLVAYRAYDQGVLAEGEGPAFEAWDAWKTATGTEALVGAAILAANAHNTQPWLFAIG